MPFEYPKRSDPRNFPNPNRNLPVGSSRSLPKPSTPSNGLSKSTRAILIGVIVLMLIGIIFIVVRGMSNPTPTPPDDEPIDRLTADLIISEVQVLNDSYLNINIEGNTNLDSLSSVGFMFYDKDDKEITKKEFSIKQLKNSDFQVILKITNTSNVGTIEIVPTFVDKEGKKVVGKVEDTYTVYHEEYHEEEIPEEEPNCILDSDCNDNNACTTNVCSEGNCSYTLIANCVSCQISSQCNDSITCTTDVCTDGKCNYLTIPGCISCALPSQCNDNNSCTSNVCFQGRCLFNQMENCKSCTNSSMCDDNNNCTNNLCLNGSCTYTPMSGCTLCNLSSQCNDSDFSTNDFCSNGKCNYTKITSCINNDKYCPSGCNITKDNDCPALSSCGNGIREGDEKCDNVSFGGASCSGVLGFGYTGTLKCTSLCTFNTSLCEAPCLDNCSSLGYNCGTKTICGVSKNCGSCTLPKTCQSNVCTCTPETNTAFCSRLLKTCGSVTALDNCKNSRTVSSCGTCTGGKTCNPLTGQCGTTCTSESNSAFCSRWEKNCGRVTALDNCGKSRSVTSCGTCAEDEICNDGVCEYDGCTPDCSELECGPDPNCGIECGPCGDNEICNDYGVCEYSDCTPDCGDLECGPEPNGCGTCGNCNPSTQTCVDGYCENKNNPPSEGALIVDHYAAMAFEDIPPSCITKAKQLTLQYAHTSHGERVLSGIDYIRNTFGSAYSVERAISDCSATLPSNNGALRIFDGVTYNYDGSCTYAQPESYWASSEGISEVRSAVSTGKYDFSMWAWCGQMSYGEDYVNQYVGVMGDLENDYAPGTRFILMTGHTEEDEGSWDAWQADAEIIRDYARNNGMILFDYGDIELYDPNGNYYTKYYSGTPAGYDQCRWCGSWCDSHPSDCTDLPECAHMADYESGMVCVQQGKAFWWMMARLAGWDGVAGHGC